MFEAHRVEGVIPLELPHGGAVMAEFEITVGGDMILKFNNYEVVNAIMGEAIRNNLVMLNLSYASALPAEPKKTEVVEDLVRLPEDVRGHAREYGFERHADGRQCSYHVRLGKYTPDGLNECLRAHIKNS